MVYLQDTKRPNKAPFPVSEEGAKWYKKNYGDRFVEVKTLIKINNNLKAPQVVIAQGELGDPVKLPAQGKRNARKVSH